MQDCGSELIGLVVLSLALLISLCLNVIFCLRQKATLFRDKNKSCYPQVYEAERGLSQEEDHYFHNLSNDEQEENPHSHHEQQENPIYGNISTDRTGFTEVCYEMMTMQHKKDRMKSSEPDLNYASLDLKVAKKHKKKYRHQPGHAQMPAQSKALLDMDADVDAQLPPRDTSTMVSHSSIYLNSQQIAQETEEMERERGMNMEWENVGWEGMRRRDDGGSRKWKDGQESEERKERLNVSNGSVCAQLSEAEAVEIGTDHFISDFSRDNEQLD